MLMRLRHSSHGDTIVEVLIAVAVASAVLSSAYAIINRTIRSQQHTNEYAQATKLAETQLEAIRYVFRDKSSFTGPARDSVYDKSITTPFCIINFQVISYSTPQCNWPTDTRYNLKNTYDATNKVFKAMVSWQDSNGQSQVSLVYRVY